MSYETNDPKGWCGDRTRGAALGRPTIHGEPQGTIHVRLSPLNRQGYDRNGTYFGGGQPLFWYSDAECNVDGVLRAPHSLNAKAQVETLFPNATVLLGGDLSLPCWGYGEETCPDHADADADYGDQCAECYAEECRLELEGDE